MTYDSNSGRMIIYGGEGFGDTWALQLTGPVAWINLNPTSTPDVRRGTSLVFDPVRNRVILFGGDDGNLFKNDVWVLNLNGPPNWSLLLPAGTPPSPRMWARGVYDAVRDRIVYYGGFRSDAILGDVWTLSLSGGEAWSEITPALGPSPRWGGVGVYDPVADRMVITMGLAQDGTKNEVWALSFADPPAWTQLFPGGVEAPLPRYLGTGVYDPARARVLIYGGYPVGESEVWQLALEGGGGEWARLAPGGGAPPGRRLHYSAFDPSNHRMVIFSGFGQNNDAWALTFPPTAPQPPAIGGFFPGGGLAGTDVTILGDHLSDATAVEFNGVDAAILTNTPTQITTQVPVGATTGRIRVTTPLGSALSAVDFIVSDVPVVSSASPDSGKVRARVTISGRNFVEVSRVSFGGSSQASYEVLSDSVIVAVVDSLATTGHIFVTTSVTTGQSSFDFRVLPLDPRPRVLAIRDVPRDQGGKVVVAWEGSDYDVPWRRLITKYRIWRRADISSMASASLRVPARDLFPARSQAAPSEFWEAIGEVPAAFLVGYAYTAATPSDSTSEDDGLVAFFVQALTTDAFGFYPSNVDSGYSVDNLSPPQPTPFTAEYGAYQVSLRWGRNRAPDFREFQLYRGTGPGFPITPEALLTSTRDTTHIDPVPGSWNYSYKLVAVDVHGNRSRVSLVSPDVPVAALVSLVSADGDEGGVRLVWFLGGNPGEVGTVYRRRTDSGWSRLADVPSDGSGYLRYEDADVEAGARYGYRLGIRDAEDEAFSDEVWVLAQTPKLLLLGPWPNPTAGGRFSIALDLPSADPARLDLWDVSGRRVESVDAGSRGRGRQVIEFGAGSKLSPGVYYLRLTQGRSALSRRVVVLE